MSKSIETTGEHTIDNIIRSEYGDLSPDELAAKKEEIARLNPHIVSLESLTVGDVVNLAEDQPEEDFIDEDLTVHTPAIGKKK